MTGVGPWLLIAALVGGLIAIQFAVRRFVTNQGKKISAVMDSCDYVVIEAHPDHAALLKSEFERNGWPFRSAAEAAGPGTLYTFTRGNGASPPLSRLFGVGGQRALLSDKKSGVDFQMKIKAHGPRSDLDA
ncbi:MAG TPA: hypothetical protein VFH89_06720 [Sphingomicrobium sp.]|nr:hypothetical protein [Sphingomicrobium sp.]